MPPAADVTRMLPEAATNMLPEVGVAWLAAVVLFYAWRGLAKLPLLPRLVLGLVVGVVVPVSFSLVVLALSPSGGLPWLRPHREETPVAVAPRPIPAAPETVPAPAPVPAAEPPQPAAVPTPAPPVEAVAEPPQPQVTASEPAPAAPEPEAPAPPAVVAAAPPDPPAPPPPSPPPGEPAALAISRGETIEVLYGTDRARAAASGPAKYTAARARRLELGRGVITAPADTELVPLQPEAFATAAGSRPADGGGEPVVVVVHGYNTGLDAAARTGGALISAIRALGNGADAQCFVYSWPSATGIASYTYDMESAAGAARPLRDFLDLVARIAAGRPIAIVAFDMGVEPVLVALSEGPLQARLKDVVLVAPDVAAAALPDRLARVSHPVTGPRITIVASADERALVVARRFHGGVARAGDAGPNGPLVFAPEADVIDATPAAAAPRGQRTLDHNPQILADIARLVATGARAAERRASGLIAARTPDGRSYWRLAPGAL